MKWAQGSGSGWPFEIFAYDGSGNIKWMGATASTRDEYRYDRVSRLREANLKSFSPVKNQKYDFDAYGNLVRVTTGLTVENFRVCTTGPPPESLPHEYCQNQSPTNRLLDGVYDEAGNLAQWSGVKHEFDSLNTLRYTTSGGAAGWDFFYTADDERVLAIQTGGTKKIWTLRDLNGQVLRHLVTDVGAQYTTSVQTDYIRRGTLLLGAITTSEGGPPEQLGESTSFGSGTTRHFALDHLGSVRLISSATGTTIGKHTYYPFGREATPSLDAEPMKFANHERDAFETGFDPSDDLDYMHARFRSPLTGRFLSMDPAGIDPANPQSWNRYTHVLGNPLTYTDPDGRNPLLIVIAAVIFAELARPDVSNTPMTPEDVQPSDRSGERLELVTTVIPVDRAIAPAGRALGRVLGIRGALRATNHAYDVALAGGRHAGTLRNYANRSLAEIDRGIRSHMRRVAEHKSWIQNPTIKVPEWSQLSPSRQRAIIENWEEDIARNSELADVLKGLADSMRMAQ